MAIVDKVAVGLGERQPTVYLDLDKAAAKQVKPFRPGQMIKVMIVGSIESLTMRKPDDPDQSGYEGNLSLNVKSMELGESARNAMAELLDDDE